MTTGISTKITETNLTIQTLLIYAMNNGTTTRLIDHYIQELFKNFGQPVEIIDENGETKELLHKVLLRLKHEHHVNIKVNGNTLTIS